MDIACVPSEMYTYILYIILMCVTLKIVKLSVIMNYMSLPVRALLIYLCG
jgi:hypothetical protein